MNVIDSSILLLAEELVHNLMSQYKKTAKALIVNRDNNAIMIQKRRKLHISFNFRDIVTIPHRIKDKHNLEKLNATSERFYIIVKLINVKITSYNFNYSG